MNKFAEKAASFTGIVTGVEGKHVVVQSGEQSLSFTVEGAVAEELLPDHEITVVTWGSQSALRVVNHTTNTTYRPYYNPDPDSDELLLEAHRSQTDVADSKMGAFALLPTVAMATVYQSIPVLGWYVTYKMISNPDKSIPGTAPQYEAQAKRYFIVFLLLAFVLSGLFFTTSGDVLKAALVYMTLLYIGTYLLMRYIFKGIEEIDDFTEQQIEKRAA